jgi:5'(3')-deoxyribonucleotidase
MSEQQIKILEDRIEKILKTPFRDYGYEDVEDYLRYKPKPIAIDIDGVLFNTMEEYLRLYNEPTKEKVRTRWRLDDITEYNFENILKISWQQRDLVFQLIDFANVNPMEKDITKTLYDLKQKHQIHFLTKTPKNQIQNKIRRFKFLGMYFDAVICVHYKYPFAQEYKYLVDDNPEELKNWVDHGGIGFLFDQPYNRKGYDFPELSECKAVDLLFEKHKLFRIKSLKELKHL